jgi:hypothetical protein
MDVMKGAGESVLVSHFTCNGLPASNYGTPDEAYARDIPSHNVALTPNEASSGSMPKLFERLLPNEDFWGGSC